MLAGLYRASGMADQAADLFAKLVASKPDALYLLPNYVRALLEADRIEDARTAKDAALATVDADPRGLDFLRRRIERIEIP